jgi:Lrp/AsnC family leucine-responsive transcriptional regulator
MAAELSNTNEPLDDLDRGLLFRLMRQGRATWADLAEELGLTAPAIAQRVRRLEERGVIKHFAAWVDAEAIAPVAAYVAVRFDRPELKARFRQEVARLDSVQECCQLAGEDDYILKVRCGSLRELEELVATTLPKIPGVARTRTSVVLSTVKDTPVLALPGAPQGGSKR